MQESNKLIARNTLYLYLRMGIIMLIKLYTSRVLLEVLGIDDYGVWNVIAGIVIAFSFISSPLSSATQRFLNYDQGKGGFRQQDIFSTSLLLFCITAVLITILLETIGLWFVNYKMNFPPDSYYNVQWVFQCSIVILVLSFVRLPYEAVLVSNEKFSFYAIISFIESFLLLGSILILKLNHSANALILYSILSLLTQIILCIVYILYCKYKFVNTKLKLVIDKKLLKNIGSFSGWNLTGSLASMTSTQGINLLLNLFSGVAINATYGICMQVTSAFSVIINNIQKAANPRIVKLFAEDKRTEMIILMINITKFPFFMIFCLSFIIMFNMEFILHLWLGKTLPEFLVAFCNITMIQLIMMCLSQPIDSVIFATGNIKYYQIALSLIIFLNIILSYIFLKLGFMPVCIVIIKCVVEFLLLMARIVFLKVRISYPIFSYIKEIALPSVCIVCTILLSTFIINNFIDWGNNWRKFFLSIVIFTPIMICCGLFFLFNSKQRKKIMTLLIK